MKKLICKFFFSWSKTAVTDNQFYTLKFKSMFVYPTHKLNCLLQSWLEDNLKAA